MESIRYRLVTHADRSLYRIGHCRFTQQRENPIVAVFLPLEAISAVAARPTPRLLMARRYYKIIEGDLVFADGWKGCHNGFDNSLNLAEVTTHELGHVIGLGHSAVSAATMYAYAHFDNRGASLRHETLPDCGRSIPEQLRLQPLPLPHARTRCPLQP